MKLPGVLVQSALVSQSSVLAIHSLISVKATESMCPRPGELLTHTGESISTVALDASTDVATNGVGTDSISVTAISISHTFINICKFFKATESMCQGQVELLTHTGESISTVALVTGTGVATRGVGTVSISVTAISISHTFINICKGY